MENDNQNRHLPLKPAAPQRPTSQRKLQFMLEERLEEHNARIAFLEQVVSLMLSEIINPGIDPMNRARLLARMGALTSEDPHGNET